MWFNTVQYVKFSAGYEVQYSTVQDMPYSTVQYVQCSTVQCSVSKTRDQFVSGVAALPLVIISKLITAQMELLYFTVLYCTVLYITVHHCRSLYCTVQCSNVVHYTVQYCTVLYWTLLYCNVLYYTVLWFEKYCRSSTPCSEGFKTNYNVRSHIQHNIWFEFNSFLK